jgi:hypothetical protein
MLVKKFWQRLVDQWVAGDVDSAIWVGFSLEQLVSLQKFPWNPMCSGLSFLVPSRRLSFLRPTRRGPKPATSPAHGSYIVLLHSKRRAMGQLERFWKEGRALGVVRLMGAPSLAADDVRRATQSIQEAA